MYLLCDGLLRLIFCVCVCSAHEMCSRFSIFSWQPEMITTKDTANRVNALLLRICWIYFKKSALAISSIVDVSSNHHIVPRWSCSTQTICCNNKHIFEIRLGFCQQFTQVEKRSLRHFQLLWMYDKHYENQIEMISEWGAEGRKGQRVNKMENHGIYLQWISMQILCVRVGVCVCLHGLRYLEMA